MKTNDEWVQEKLAAYKKDPNATLIDLLQMTTDTIQTFAANPESRAAMGLLITAFECNNLFLNHINK